MLLHIIARGKIGRSPEADLDLTQPVRLVPNDDSNLLMVVSSEGNVRAVEQLAGLLDRLPSSGSATVRLFPLERQLMLRERRCGSYRTLPYS